VVCGAIASEALDKGKSRQKPNQNFFLKFGLFLNEAFCPRLSLKTPMLILRYE